MATKIVTNDNERVQTHDLDSPEAIHPRASGVDTYFRPAEAQVAKPGVQAQWAKDLAEGLDVLQPSYQRFAEATTKQITAEEMARGAEARSRNQASFRDAISKGIIPEGASPWFKKGYEQQSGRLEGMEYDTALRLAWSQSPIQNSDNPKAYDDFVADFRQNFLRDRQGSRANLDWYEGFAPMQNRAENNLSAQHIAHRQHAISLNVREGLSRETLGQIDSWRDSQRTELTGLAEANASVDEIRNAKLASIGTLGANLSAMTKDLVAKGLSGSDANKLVTDAVVIKARESRDPDLLNLLDHVQTGSGTLAGTQYAKEHRLAAQEWIRKYDYNEMLEAEHREDRPYTLEQQKHARESWGWAKEAHDRSIKEQNRADETRALHGMLGAGIIANPTQPLDMSQLARIEKLSPGSAQAVVGFQQFMLTNRERIVTNNDAFISILSDMQKNYDTFNVQKIWDGVTAKQYDAGAATTLFNEWKSLKDSEGKDPLLKDQEFLRYRLRLESAVAGNPAQITGVKISDSGSAGVAFYREMREFNEKNPQATRAEKSEFMDKRYEANFKRFAGDVADQTVVNQEKVAADAAKLKAEKEAREAEESAKRNQALDSRLKEMGVSRGVLRAYTEAVAFGDEVAQAEILKKYPQLAPKKKKAQ